MFQGIGAMLVARGTPVAAGGGGITWTERATENFFPCTAGQGNSGSNITVCNAAWTQMNTGTGNYVCNGAANGAGGLTTSGGGANNHCLYYYNTSVLATQYAQLTLVTVPGDGNDSGGGPAIRVQSSGVNCYFLNYYNSAGTKALRLGVVNSDTVTVVQTTPKTYTAGVKLRLEVTGTGSSARLTGYEDTGSGWVAVFSSIDPGGTYLDGGFIGTWGYGSNAAVEIDDWSGGDGV